MIGIYYFIAWYDYLNELSMPSKITVVRLKRYFTSKFLMKYMSGNVTSIVRRDEEKYLGLDDFYQSKFVHYHLSVRLVITIFNE